MPTVLGRARRALATVRKSGIGTRSTGASRKKRAADRRGGRSREALELLEGRADLTLLSGVEPGEPIGERIDAQTGAFTRPAQQFRVHLDAFHVFHWFQDSMRSTIFAICSFQSNRDSISSLVM